MELRKRHKSIGSSGSAGDDTLNENEEVEGLFSFLFHNKFKVALLVRLVSCFLTQTFFVPDEYWQSTEVAHQNVFHYGYLTWEWKERIRSYLYPFIFEIYFRILKLFSMDTCFLVKCGPHVLQSILTACSDVSVFTLSYKLTNCKTTAMYSYVLNISSWFVFYTGSRTLSNTAEMCFSTIGLSLFPYQRKEVNFKCASFALLFGSVASIIRPTCLLIWAPLILHSLVRKHISIIEIFLISMCVLPILAVLLFGIDYYFYGSFTFVHWNFVRFNIFENIGTFYGAHECHWYFTQGLPVVLTIHLLFVIVGILKMKRSILLEVAFIYILIHSCIVHKEFRFMLPIVPILMCMAGRGFKHATKYLTTTKLMALVLTVNIPLSIYFCLIHQQGTINVIKFVEKNVSSPKKSVLFLMPCHSTPYYSYLHENLTMRFLTCEPSTVPGYEDESDQFFSKPKEWLKKEFNGEQFVIAYDRFPKVAKQFLMSRNYTIIDSFFHTHFPEGNIGGNIHVYSKG